MECGEGGICETRGTAKGSGSPACSKADAERVAFMSAGPLLGCCMLLATSAPWKQFAPMDTGDLFRPCMIVQVLSRDVNHQFAADIYYKPVAARLCGFRSRWQKGVAWASTSARCCRSHPESQTLIEKLHCGSSKQQDAASLSTWGRATRARGVQSGTSWGVFHAS